MSEPTTLLDRPINGDRSWYSERNQSEQWDETRFLADLDRLLDTEGVEAVRWTQYTPYFNDGDACVFHTGEIYVKVKGLYDEKDLEDEDEYYEDESNVWRGSYQLYEYATEGDWRSEHVYNVNGVDTSKVSAALNEFASNMEHYEIVVLKHFGDPAKVTATKLGFDVEFYEHD